MLRAVLLVLLFAGQSAEADEGRVASVGMPARIRDLVLPGSELQAVSTADRKAKIVLSIDAVSNHGSAKRYDLTWYGLEPGKYDLRDWLKRADGKPLAELPPIQVEVISILPAGQIVPADLEPHSTPELGGYRFWLTTAIVLWFVGLLAILLIGRKRARAAVAASGPTVADRLRPLVDKAIAGELSTVERADLERTLLSFWRKRLRLEDVDPADAMTSLAQNPDSGALIARLEDWLHRPSDAQRERVDVPALLEPYRSIRAEEWDAAKGGMA